MSPVTMGVGPDGAILIASYPERAKVRNLRLHPMRQCAFCRMTLVARGSRFQEQPLWSIFPKRWKVS